MIGRDGFAAATVGDDHARGGRSLGLLNYHFGSKDEVVAEAFAAAAREDLAALEAISRRFEDPAERLAAYLDQSEWADADSWRLWVDAWGESVHSPLVRDTLGRFDVGWRAVLAEVLADGVRQGRWECADPQDTAARLVAVLDGIGLHTTVHGEDVPPERATAWARRLAELELGVDAARAAAAGRGRRSPRACTRRGSRSARATSTPHGHVDPAVLFTFLEEARAAWLGARVPGRGRHPRRGRLPPAAGPRPGDRHVHAGRGRPRELPHARDGRRPTPASASRPRRRSRSRAAR